MVPLDTLENVDFLKDIDAAHLAHIAALGELKEYSPNTVLFHQGQESLYVYLLLTGEVRLEMLVLEASTMPVQTVGPGELLGWSSLLRLGPMTATARTLPRCRLVALNVRTMMELCQEDPHFGMEFFRRMAATMSSRLSATRSRLVHLACPGDTNQA